MEFRKAELSDADAILKMYNDGEKSLAKDNVDQWQGKEAPNLSNFEELIEKGEIFVLEDGVAVATAILNEHDPNYDRIYEGSWIYDLPYIAIHRVAVLDEFKRKGFGKKLFEEIEKYAKSRTKALRIDTHRNNLKMQKLINSCGYTYCGIIYLKNKKERLAYEKIID